MARIWSVARNSARLGLSQTRFFALPVVLVKRGPQAIFRGYRDLVEDFAGVQGGHSPEGVGGNFDDGHFRQLAADPLALHGAIVIKRQRVEADAQLFGDGAQAGCLVAPMDLGRGKILPVEHHVGVMLEDLPHFRFIILAGDGQQNAAVAQGADGLLEVPVDPAGVIPAERDSSRPGLAEDAAPQGVVQIQNQALGGGHVEGANQARQSPGDRDLGGRGERHSRDIIQPRIEELPQAGFESEPGEVEHGYSGMLARNPVEQRIGILHHAGGRPADSPRAGCRLGEIEDHHRAGLNRPDCGDGFGDAAARLGGQALALGFRQGFPVVPQGRHEVFEASGDHHDVRLLGEEGAFRGGALQLDLAIGGEPGLEVEAAPRPFHHQVISQRLGGKAGGDGNPQRFQVRGQCGAQSPDSGVVGGGSRTQVLKKIEVRRRNNVPA